MPPSSDSNPSNKEAPPPRKKAKVEAPDDVSRFSRLDLRPFNLLKHPVWIFDIERKAMWWANDAALELWNAESLSALIERDFASDMSEGTEKRIRSYLEGFHRGETYSDQVSTLFFVEQRCC